MANIVAAEALKGRDEYCIIIRRPTGPTVCPSKIIHY
jgi:hypothetical protein